MVETDQTTSTHNQADRIRTQVETFARENRRALQITGIVAAAGVAGTVGSVLALKSIAAGKGAAAAKAALAGKGAVAAKAGATSLPALLAPQGARSVGAIAASPATTGIAMPSIGTLLSNGAASGAALAGKATGLMSPLTGNALPLVAALVGGGAAVGGVVGAGLARPRVRTVQAQLAAQITAAEMAQAEKAQVQSLLTLTQADLSELQAKLNAQQEAALAKSFVTHQTQPPTTPPARLSGQERLERIHGIGRASVKRLNAAGIYTLTDLATQRPETLEAIFEKTRGGLFQPEAWIEEARQLSDEQDEVIALSKAPDTTDVVTQIVLPSDSRPDATLLVLERLEAIDGISPEIAAHLNQSGIFTYADFAEQDPARIATIIPHGPQLGVAGIKEWIHAARVLIEPK